MSKYKFDRDFVVFLVEKGYSTATIADIINCPSASLYQFMASHKIPAAKTVSNQCTPFQVAQIIHKYVSESIPSTEIAESFGVSCDTVLRILKLSGVDIKTNLDYINKNFNHSAFDDFSNEHASYFYGLLLADGCLSKDLSRLSIQVKSTDSELLEKLKEFLNSDCNINAYSKFDRRTNKTYHSSNFSIGSKNIIEKFMQMGYSPKKSLKEVAPPSILSNSRDFWRGMIDGDGHISKTRALVNLCGSRNIISKFKEVVEGLLPISLKRNIYIRDNGLCSIDYTGEDAVSILKWLYKDSVVFLSRKKEAARQIIDNHKTDVNGSQLRVTNKTGISCIFFQDRKPQGRFACCFKKDGKSVTFYFSVRKYGKEGAFRLAREKLDDLRKDQH